MHKKKDNVLFVPENVKKEVKTLDKAQSSYEIECQVPNAGAL